MPRLGSKNAPTTLSCAAVLDAREAFVRSLKNGTKQFLARRFRNGKYPKRAIKFQPENYCFGTWYPEQVKGLLFKASEPPTEEVEPSKQKDN